MLRSLLFAGGIVAAVTLGAASASAQPMSRTALGALPLNAIGQGSGYTTTEVRHRRRARRAHRRAWRRHNRRAHRRAWRRHHRRHRRPSVYLSIPVVPYYATPRRTRSSDRCEYWGDRCVDNWGYGNSDYYGCLRYHGCY